MNLNAQYTFGALPKTYRMYPQILVRSSNKMRCIVDWLSEIPKYGGARGGARFVRLENGHFASLSKADCSWQPFETTGLAKENSNVKHGNKL